MKGPAQDRTSHKTEDSNPGPEGPKPVLILAYESALRGQELWLGPGCPHSASYVVSKRRLVWLSRWLLPHPSPGPRTGSHVFQAERAPCAPASLNSGVLNPVLPTRDPKAACPYFAKWDSETQAQRSQRTNLSPCDMWSILTWPYQQQGDC